jgi:ferritin-like metal-binding protein YciE
MAGIDSLESLLQDELKDIYDAEKQITKALPKMIKKAEADELRTAFEEHLQQTERHIERLEQVFEHLELPARGKKCVGMQNLIKEGQDMIADAEDNDTRDALMIAAAQKIEHYEIATYGTLRVWAGQLGHSEAASLLAETLEEEKETDQRLTSIAESFVNQAAANQGDEEKEQDRPRARQSSSRSGSQSRASRMLGGGAPRQQAADRGGRSGRGRGRSR